MRFAGAAVVIRSQVLLTGPAVRVANIGMSYGHATDLSLTGGCVLNALSLLPLTHLTPALLESANSVSLPTSSSSTPTSTTPAPTAPKTKTVSINDGEDVVVGADTEENFWSNGFMAVNDSAFKCVPCGTVTIHQGWEAIACREMLKVVPGEEVRKRVYLCTNCGKFATK